MVLTQRKFCHRLESIGKIIRRADIPSKRLAQHGIGADVSGTAASVRPKISQMLLCTFNKMNKHQTDDRPRNLVENMKMSPLKVQNENVHQLLFKLQPSLRKPQRRA